MRNRVGRCVATERDKSQRVGGRYVEVRRSAEMKIGKGYEDRRQEKE